MVKQEPVPQESIAVPHIKMLAKIYAVLSLPATKRFSFCLIRLTPPVRWVRSMRSAQASGADRR